MALRLAQHCFQDLLQMWRRLDFRQRQKVRITIVMKWVRIINNIAPSKNYYTENLAQ
jgi:hypothetical protein